MSANTTETPKVQATPAEIIAHRLSAPRFQLETVFIVNLCRAGKATDDVTVKRVDQLRDYLARKANEATQSSGVKKVSKTDKDGNVKLTFEGGSIEDKASLWSDIAKAAKIHADLVKVGVNVRFDAESPIVKRLLDV